MSQLSLGIDLGTTSVKIVLLDCAQDRIIFESSLESKATISVSDPLKNEQSVSQIFSTVDRLLEGVSSELLANVRYIGVSGQMHGCLLWKAAEAWSWKDGDGDTIGVNKTGTTNLVTWQDSRCTPEFLSSLPSPDSHLGVHTGFGIPTIFWLQRNEPFQLERFDSAGTIQDFLVSALTNNLKKPLMSSQNAASWGYFNTSKGDWNRDILEGENFPLNLLPEVIEASNVAGDLYGKWHGIPKGCKIGVGLGDLQASIYSTLFDKPELTSAFLNISTSAQLAFVLPSGFEPQEFRSNSLNSIIYKGIEFFPYFQGRYIAVAAALTGGNCLATFVGMISGWMQEMGLDVDKNTIWSKILDTGALQKATDLVVEPTFLGERSEPMKRGSVSNAHTDNLTLGHWSRAICKGIVSNLSQLMPQDFLIQFGIERIHGTGSAYHRNVIFQEEMANIFDKIKVEISDRGDSSVGAAALGKRFLAVS